MPIHMPAAPLPREGRRTDLLTARIRGLLPAQRGPQAQILRVIRSVLLAVPPTAPRRAPVRLAHLMRSTPAKRRAAVQCAIQLVVVAAATVGVAWLSWSATIEHRREAEQRRPAASAAALEGSLRGDLTRSTAGGVATRTRSAPAQERDVDSGAAVRSTVTLPGPVLAGGIVAMILAAGLLLGRLVLRRYRAMTFVDLALRHLPLHGAAGVEGEPEDLGADNSAPDDHSQHDAALEVSARLTATPEDAAPDGEGSRASSAVDGAADAGGSGRQQQDLAEMARAGLLQLPDAEGGTRHASADALGSAGQAFAADDAAQGSTSYQFGNEPARPSLSLLTDSADSPGLAAPLMRESVLELAAGHEPAPLTAESGHRLYERRAAARVPYVAAGVLEHQGQQWSITMLDLSESGARCRVEPTPIRSAPSLPSNGQYVRISFPVASTLVNVKAQVAWRRPGDEGIQMGLSFVSPPAETVKRIRHAIHAAAGN